MINFAWKTIIEKGNFNYLIFSFAVASIACVTCFVLSIDNPILLSFLFAAISFSVYCILLFASKMKSIRMGCKSDKIVINGVWEMFLGLSDESLKFACDILELEKDKYNKYHRILRSDSLRMIDNYAFRVDLPHFCDSCIKYRTTGNTTTIIIEKHFYMMISHYKKTGVKKRF